LIILRLTRPGPGVASPLDSCYFSRISCEILLRSVQVEEAEMTPVRLAAVDALVLCLIVIGSGSSRADGENGTSARGPLDGMSFIGTLGPEGKPGDRDDVIKFAGGHFWSENCVPCGFPPGPYWVRYEDAAIHFQGELESPSSGHFSYVGTVEDGAS
jgi:hypothetical protein